MIFMKYKQPKAEYVQFQRLLAGLLILSAILTENIIFTYIFLLLSTISFITTLNYSPSTLLFKLISFLNGRPLFVTPPQYVHSYMVHRLATIFEDLMRIAGGIAMIYFYSISPTISWMIGSFMAIAMLISSFYGFCLSALLYIGYTAITKSKQ